MLYNSFHHSSCVYAFHQTGCLIRVYCLDDFFCSLSFLSLINCWWNIISNEHLFTKLITVIILPIELWMSCQLYEKNLFKCRLIPLEMVEIWNVSNVESRRRSTQITWKLNQINNIWQQFNLHHIEIKNIKHYQLPVFGVWVFRSCSAHTHFIFIKAIFSMTQSFTVKWIPKIMAINVAFLLFYFHIHGFVNTAFGSMWTNCFFFIFHFSFISSNKLFIMFEVASSRNVCAYVLTLGHLFISFSSFIE